MTKVKVKLVSKGVRALLTAPGVQADLDRRARRIANAAGEGFEVARRSQKGPRARAVVVTATREAMMAEANYRALTRAIDAGR